MDCCRVFTDKTPPSINCPPSVKLNILSIINGLLTRHFEIVNMNKFDYLAKNSI